MMKSDKYEINTLKDVQHLKGVGHIKSSFPLSQRGIKGDSYSTLFLILFIALTLTSCELFMTREPEPPDTSRPVFVPPTSPELVIQNLINAFSEKNADNYAICFADETFDGFPFVFQPASDASSSFPGVFTVWDINSERRYFESVSLSIAEGVSPELQISTIFPNYLKPDSAILVTDYRIRLNHQRQDIPQNYSGTLQFTFRTKSGGLWCISDWYDTPPTQSDTTAGSWSLIKAYFY
jgi:hypothetical protein